MHDEGAGGGRESKRSIRAERAFVIQVDESIDERRSTWSGRVEHVVSGRSSHFGAAEELIEFTRRVLRAETKADREWRRG